VIADNLDEPTAVATGSGGEVYVSTGHGGAIYQVLPELKALTPPEQASFDRREVASPARLRPFEGLLVDGDRLIFSDTGNFRLCALSLTGKPIVTTLLAGDNFAGPGALGVGLALPRGIASYHGGYALVDGGNSRILYLDPSRSAIALPTN
jgi:hypothetical protein